MKNVIFGEIMNSMQFLEQIKTYSELYKTWFEPIKQFKKKYTAEPNFSYKELAQDVETFTDQQRAKNDLPKEINAFLDQNFIVYLDSAPEDCEKIRVSFNGNRDFENFLFHYTQRAVAQLQITNEEIYLWRGLVSTSLENCGIDFRDTLAWLANLYIIAEEKQLNPSSAFQKVAKISSQKIPRGGPTSMYEIMTNFESYAILTERRNKK